jgi:Calcineurin-like phosphoesterase
MHYVVSDVHGHVGQLVAALRHVNLLDSDGAWCGGRARLTFLGDYFDRGPDGIAVVELIRRLQSEADMTGGRVDALIGNHEILALGMTRFGGRRVPSDLWSRPSFARTWALNGGQVHDQKRLTDGHIEWLCGLDSVVLAGPDLLLHSDTTEYLRWGHTTQQINDAVRKVLAGDDLEQWWQCWGRLTTRYAFAGLDGEQVATELLDVLGGERIVHGHSVIATFTGQHPSVVAGPLSYAGGRALAIDGGIYCGGRCLVVRLDHDPVVANA